VFLINEHLLRIYAYYCALIEMLSEKMEGANYRIDPQEILLGLIKNPIVYLRMLGVVSLSIKLVESRGNF